MTEVEKKRLQVEIPKDTHKRISVYAIEQETQLADVVRDALTEYFSARGLELDFSVAQWGGDRHGDKQGAGDGQ